ncbi:MAG: HlyC/CorC family transporter [Holosporaceae bacterium]
MILLIMFFACASFFLSASETALTSASPIRLHHFHKQGFKHAKLVLELQKNMSQIIATILLANTVVLTSLTAICTNFFTASFGETGVLYAAVLLSALITIYLEVLPKALTYTRAERAAMFVAPTVRLLQKSCFPLTRLIDVIAHMSLRLVGMSSDKGVAKISTLDELKGAIDLHIQAHAAAPERIMLKNILDLTSITVEEVMVHRHHMFALDCTLKSADLVKQVLNSPFTRIPLWKNVPENIVGLLHIKTLFCALEKRKPDEIDITKVQTEPWFIPASTTLIAQLQAFRKRREHFAFVVDEYGALIGIVTLEDILEEIVGDIKDEYDEPLTGITLLGDNRFLVEGTVSLRDLNREHALELPENGATTLAGLLLDVAGYIPKEKQVFKAHGLKIKVIKRHRNQIKLLEVSFQHTDKKADTSAKPDKRA